MPRTTFLTLKFGRDHWYWTGIAGAVVLIAILAVLQMNPTIPVVSGENDETIPLAKIGEPAPDFALSTLDGQTFSLSSFRGRPVVLYFWASWCSFCRNEMPGLNVTFETHRDSSDLVVLAINILEDAATVRHYMQNLGISFPVLLDRDGKATQQYLVRATPSYYFIDRNGILQARIIGTVRPAAFRARLEAILKSPSSGTDPSTSPETWSQPQAEPHLL